MKTPKTKYPKPKRVVKIKKNNSKQENIKTEIKRIQRNQIRITQDLFDFFNEEGISFDVDDFYTNHTSELFNDYEQKIKKLKKNTNKYFKKRNIDKLTLYRAASNTDEHLAGFNSWTDDIEIAKAFA